MLFRSALAGAALAALTALPSAAATAVTPNSGWVVFNFGEVGSSFSNEPFTFTLTKAGALKVTDAFAIGDQFEIFDFGASMGLTSTPSDDGTNAGSDYDLAYGDARWSSGMWVLGPGSYSITGLAVLSPYGGGDGALMVSQVPLPAAGLMLMVGLAGLAGLRRKHDA